MMLGDNTFYSNKYQEIFLMLMSTAPTEKQVLLATKNLNINDIFGMVKTEKIVTAEEMDAAVSELQVCTHF